MCVTKPIFFEKFSLGENDQKWPLNSFFLFFRKIKSLVLSGSGAEWKYLWSFNILWKLHAWEKSDSKGVAKHALNQWDFSFF